MKKVHWANGPSDMTRCGKVKATAENSTLDPNKLTCMSCWYLQNGFGWGAAHGIKTSKQVTE